MGLSTSQCKRCRKPIYWTRVERVWDSASPNGRAPKKDERRWIPMDLDDVPHGCGEAFRRGERARKVRDGKP